MISRPARAVRMILDRTRARHGGSGVFPGMSVATWGVLDMALRTSLSQLPRIQASKSGWDVCQDLNSGVAVPRLWIGERNSSPESPRDEGKDRRGRATRPAALYPSLSRVQ